MFCRELDDELQSLADALHPAAERVARLTALMRECRASLAAAGIEIGFPDITGRYAEALRVLDRRPVARDGGRINAAVLAGAVWTAFTRAWAIPYLPLVIEHAARRDVEAVRRFVAAMDTRVVVGRTNRWLEYATGCHDAFVGATERSEREAMRRYPWLIDESFVPGETDQVCRALQPRHAPMAFFAPVAAVAPINLDAARRIDAVWKAAGKSRREKRSALKAVREVNGERDARLVGILTPEQLKVWEEKKVEQRDEMRSRASRAGAAPR